MSLDLFPLNSFNKKIPILDKPLLDAFDPALLKRIVSSIGRAVDF